MSGFGDLARLGATIRPLSNLRPTPAHRRAQFSATFASTTALLARELRHLGAKTIVVELDFRDRDLRLDGLPRADARMGDPTVVLSFESRYGPLRYATAEYSDWTDNLRAIALSMESLRAVDRYGVSKRGEQYQGWRAIPQSTDATSEIQTADDALDFLATYLDDGVRDLDINDVIRHAIKKSHPDTGGNTDDFRRVMRAKELLA